MDLSLLTVYESCSIQYGEEAVQKVAVVCVVGDTVQVEAAYDSYNIQAPVEDVSSGLATDGIQNVTIKSHNVVAATSETNDGGKYDAMISMARCLRQLM